MSKAQRIDDHKAWMGSRGKGVPLPMESKMKEERSAEGAGKLGEYDQTTEDIRRDQMSGEGKLKSKPMKPGYRY